MDILTRIADAMQGVLMETADIIAFETEFVKRQWKMTGSKFAQMLVFGWLDNPDATLDQLTQTGIDIGLEISPQGLDQRFSQEGARCLHRVLEEAIKAKKCTFLKWELERAYGEDNPEAIERALECKREAQDVDRACRHRAENLRDKCEDGKR